jgi:uncharacterized protein (DUF305 family)
VPAEGTPAAGDTMTGGTMGSPAAGMPAMTDFDLMFIDMMIVHHEGAVAMARVALERAEYQEVRDLARQIVDSQQAEIDQMRTWREAWYPDAPVMPMDQMAGMMTGIMDDPHGTASPDTEHADDHGATGAGTMGMMGTMDPRAEARALCDAPDPFDRAFLEAMIPHHQSAIAMAELALHHASNAEIQRLAQRIVEAQRAEVAQMETWLAAWYGGTPAAG